LLSRTPLSTLFPYTTLFRSNGSWCGPSATRGGTGPTNPDWFRVGGGDGFYTQIDPTDYNTIYSESQNGAMSRLDLKTGRNVSIRSEEHTSELQSRENLVCRL